MLYVTTEYVNLDLEWNGLFLDMYSPLPGCVAVPQNELWKHCADEAAADRSQGSHSDLPSYLCESSDGSDSSDSSNSSNQ